ncbi:MAG: Hsp20/alpha crystallin family protein [Thermoplasmata archaeon]|nr:MAG: Hsp20/alpha crystallin family protein [Thermoplasmata archaeon]
MKPFDILNRMEKEFEELRRAFGIAMARRKPYCDVIERENEIILLIDLPGFSKKDVEIEVGEGYVRVKAERKEEEKGEYVIKERMKSFYRRIELPGEIKIDETKAKLRNGVLEIILPKKEGKKGRKIRVD